MTNRADNFNRSDRSLSGDTPSDGLGAWTITGTWTILGNNAYKSATFNTHQPMWLEASVANVEVQATNATLGNGGLVCRLSDSSNFIYARVNAANNIIYKVVAGAFTQLGSTYTGSGSANDVWLLSADSSNNLLLKQNGTTRVTTSDSFNSSATKHGINDFSTAARWDDFSITEIVGAAVSQKLVFFSRQAVNRAAVR